MLWWELVVINHPAGNMLSPARKGLMSSVAIKTKFWPPTTVDKGGSAYFYLDHEKAFSARQMSVIAKDVNGAEQGTIVLDFDRAGKLIGIEIVDAAYVLSESMLKLLSESE